MLNTITSKLDKLGINDYEVSDKISTEAISVGSDLEHLKIYIPTDLEYSQYEIDDFIRDMIPSARTSTELDRNIYVMQVRARLNESQYFNLIKYIIEDHEYCILLENK